MRSHSQQVALGFTNLTVPWAREPPVCQVSKGFGSLGKRGRAVAEIQVVWEVEMSLTRIRDKIWKSCQCPSHPSCLHS